jgi:hypothetical protein
MRGTDVCYPHRHHRLAGVTVSLLELTRLAETFDQRSRSAGELYPAADFVSWLAPELDMPRRTS